MNTSRDTHDGTGRLPLVGVSTDVTEQKQAQEELRASRELYRLLAENSADVVLRVGNDGVILWVSPSVQPTLGWEPEQLSGRLLDDFTLADECAAFVETAREIVAGSRPGHIIVYLRCADESYRWLEGRSHEVVGPDGLASRVLGLRDIQAEVEARAALASSRVELQATLDGLLDPHVLLRPVRDAHGGIVDFVYVDGNRAACVSLHVERDQLVGGRLLGVRPGEREMRMLTLCAEAVESGEPIVLDEVEAFGSEPSDRRFDVRAVPLGDDLSLTWRDVTERHEAARQLAESEERYRLLAENAADVVFVVSEGIPTWVSPSVTQVMGCRPEDVVGQPVSTWVHPDDLAAVYASVQAGRAGAEQKFEIRLRTRDGSYHWMAVVTRPIRDASGAVVSASCCMRDVHAEVEARTALERSEQLLRRTLDSLLEPHVVLRAVRGTTGHVVDFTCTDANPAACTYMRLPREQLVGERLLALIPGLVKSGLLHAYARVLETGEPLVLDDFGYRLEVSGSIERRFDIRAVRIDADTLSHTWRDVTPRYEAAEAIRRQVGELAALQRLAELLVTRPDLSEALDSACRLLSETLEAETADIRLLPAEAAEGDVEQLTARNAIPSADGVVQVAEADGRRLLVVPLRAHDEELGTLLLHKPADAAGFSAEQQGLAQTAGDLLAAVIWIEHLHAEEKEEVAGAERQRIARDLHDAVTQNIYAATMLMESLPAVYERDALQGRDDLLTIRRLVRAAFAELRILLYELRPETLAVGPLEVIFERLRDALIGRGDIEVDLSVEPDIVVPSDVRIAFYRVAQEALSNTGKYAQAARVTVLLGRDASTVRLTVHDDGRGFDPATTTAGMGQSTMRERAAAIGAALSITSAPGAGTTVTLEWRPAPA